MKKAKLSASILNADFSKLDLEIGYVSPHVNEFHLDIMDGHFVPNISFGPGVVKAVRKITKLPLDVHLMIEEPMKYIDQFVDAGADTITFHDGTVNYFKCRDYIRGKNVRVGIAYNPGNPVYIFDSDIDRVLIMSVHPGFGGQKFIGSALKKISQTRKWIDKKGYNIEVAVDGGIKVGTAYNVVKHGADVVIVGSSIFEGDKQRNILDLRKDIDRWYKKKRL